MQNAWQKYLYWKIYDKDHISEKKVNKELQVHDKSQLSVKLILKNVSDKYMTKTIACPNNQKIRSDKIIIFYK